MALARMSRGFQKQLMVVRLSNYARSAPPFRSYLSKKKNELGSHGIGHPCNLTL